MKAKICTLVVFSFILVGCNTGGGGGSTEEVPTLIGDIFETSPTASGQVQVGQCYEEQHAPLPDTIVRKMDIIIVPDTSGSIIEERGNIANGFEFFINSLPVEIDYRIGVVLGHGPGSAHAGALYQKGTEALVLDSQIDDKATIIAGLNAKMANPATQSSTDGGEMGIYSLNEAITTNLATIQGQGLLRADAAVVIIFVADEQDICAQFPDGVVPVPDPQGKEISSYNAHCDDGNGNLSYQPEQILTALESLQGERPLVVGGVIYNNSQTVPLNGENEIGYGYLETIELAGGLSVDLASGDYSQGLANLGKLAQVSVAPANDFNLATNTVDPSTIEVLVNNSPADYTYDSVLNIVSLTVPRDDFDVVKLNYCEKAALPKQVSKIISGGNHTCAILYNGNLKCWGLNSKGQLGQGHANKIGDDEIPSSTVAIDFGQRIIDASAGLNHTCVILEDGSVKCWGDNSSGQLGLGDTLERGIGETADQVANVPLGGQAMKIYSGTKYNCALLSNQAIKCWGDNTFGQLGYGHTNNLGDDELISSYGNVPVGDNVVNLDISTVSNHTCAVLKSNDGLKCWGLNSNGQLGYGHTNNLGDDEAPSTYGAIPFSHKILQVATGLTHTCALTGGQQVQCWGLNAVGQAGYGSTDISAKIGDDESADNAGFVNLGISGSLSVATGTFHTCALGVDESAYCFGNGINGQTGHGNNLRIGDDEVLTNANTKVEIDLALSQVATGFNHSCVLTKDEGRVICFGLANNGQLGYGNTNKIGDDEAPWEFVEILSPSELPL